MKYDLRVRDSFGKQLEVLQELPNKGDKFPTVVMVPGFGVDLHEYGYFDDISGVLIKHGFQTFRFSFEGTGKSEGDFLEMTIDTQAKQLKDILDYIKKDRFTNKRKIGILAQSFGTATVTAALPLTGIKTFLFTSASAYPYESLSKFFKRQWGFNPEGISKRERSDKSITSIGSQFWKSLQNLDLIKKISLLTSPILFIYGKRDQYVKSWEAEDFFNAVKGKKRLSVIEKADHAFTRQFRPKVLELIAEWFDETLS